MHLSNASLIELAGAYGTPLYVYNGDLITQRYRELHQFIDWPKLRILYAMKANYNPDILSLLNDHGAWLDAVSPGDVIMARRLGFPANRILYTANNLADHEVDEVRRHNVLMNIGSLSRLRRYGAAYPGSRVCIRLNPDVVAGAHAKIRTGGDLTKFGILLEDVEQVRAIAAQYNLTIVGLHEHTGSGIADTSKVLESIGNILAVATPGNFPNLEFVDFGGGFKVPYHPEERRIDYVAFGRELGAVFRDFCRRYGRELWMYFEPGKYIVAEAGNLLITANTLKDNRGRRIVGADAGFPQLIRPMFYEAYHHIANLSNPDGPETVCDVCGNICETGDRFAENRALPEVREGDVLAIRNAGAYCYAMGGVYNLRPMPAEVLVTAGNARLVRRRLSNAELVAQILEERP